jgi:hypothetical protein
MRKLSDVVVQSGVQVYREIVPVALFSAISSVVLLPFIFFLPAGLALIFIPLLYVPLCTGVLYAGHRILKGERSRIRLMFEGAWKHYGASLGFALIVSFFVLILVSSWWYYGSRQGVFYFALSVFQTYFVAMVFVSQIYTLPLIVQEGMGLFSAIGRSFKLFVSHPLYTIGAFLQIVCLTVILGITVVGFACLYVGMLGIYANLVTANLLPKPDRGSAPRDEESGRGGNGSSIRHEEPMTRPITTV